MNDKYTERPEQQVKPLRNELFRRLAEALRKRSDPSRQTPSEQLLRESRDER
ncbi:MAG: hypothetical protein ABIF28_15785 [Pseudomonadota bacterium]